MNNLPTISVIVPSYNQGRFLAECLDSITRQDYPHVELIVMDGGSTDESVEIIRRHAPGIAYWQSKRDGGQSAAINAGAARASGDIVAWLNSDDLYTDDALWIVGRAWRRHPGRALYVGNGFRLDDITKVRTRHNRRHMGMSRRALREGLDYIQQPSAFFSLEEWREVGGLDEKLRYCMDWDMLIRLAERGPVVLMNDFLSLSREYEDTKTASGGLERCAELCAMVRSHTSQDMTIGGAVYVTETLMGAGLGAAMTQPFRDEVYSAFLEARSRLAELGAASDGSPDYSDPGDVSDVPIPTPDDPPTYDPAFPWPRITVVTPSYNQAQYLERTLRSIIDQGYPDLEMIVMDGGSTDGSVEIIHKYEMHLAHWESNRDRGPAHAINQGFARSTGEVLIWLNSDDMFAEDALRTVGKAFGTDQELDLVYGDALYTDEHDVPIVMDHGEYKTSHYFGRMVPRDQVPAYWSYVHSVPQPTTYFRRRLIERLGSLDESYKFIFDFELFFRLMHQTKIRKIDKVMAFYRIHTSAKTSGWSDFLVELYRFSRAWWPSVGSAAFKGTRAEFMPAFMNRYWGGRRRDWRFKIAEARFSRMVTKQTGNPEEVLALRDRKAAATASALGSMSIPPLVEGVKADETAHPLARRAPRYRVVFCSLFLPRFPGMSGGEIRDFHLVRGLLEFCRVTMVVLHPNEEKNRQQDLIGPELDAYYDPTSIRATTPELLDKAAMTPFATPEWIAMDRRRLAGLPVVGREMPRDVEISTAHYASRIGGTISRLLAQDPDFVLVSPQTNPAAMFLGKASGNTRFIFATYDVESVRLRRLGRKTAGLKRLGSHLETRRGTRYERAYLRHFDGVIAVSELDKRIFVEEYGVAPERVAVINNGVDTAYFAMRERRVEGPLVAMFPANFGYPPNPIAAMRLATRIMPLLWRTHSDAELWLVGREPTAEMLALNDGKRIFVTGQVDSVLPYFENASFMCAPLELGSGTKTKVIEALSAGIPVVCTRLAAEGIHARDGEHLIIRDGDAEMAAEMARLFADPERVTAMARAGRRVAEDNYSWDSVLPKLEPWLDTLASLPRISSSAPPPIPSTWDPPILGRGMIEIADERFPALIGSGWSHVESTHIWSLAGESVLWLKLDADSHTARFLISGNPHVDGRVQQLLVMVNDTVVADQRLSADDRSVLELDCAGPAWQHGQVNRITFKPSPTTSCRDDARDMGLCLWHIEIR